MERAGYTLQSGTYSQDHPEIFKTSYQTFLFLILTTNFICRAPPEKKSWLRACLQYTTYENQTSAFQHYSYFAHNP